MSVQNVCGLIFAAGFGSRLLPFTAAKPKPLLPVLNVPLALWSIDRLSAAGITSIAVSTQAAHEFMFRHLLGDGRRLGVELTYVVEEQPRGTGGTVASITDFWQDRTLLTVDADILSTLDIQHFLEFHKAGGADATISVLRHPWRPADFTGDVVELADGSDRIIRYQHKPGSAARSRLAATGFVALEPSVAAFSCASIPEFLTAGPDQVDLGRDIICDLVTTSEYTAVAYRRPHRFVDFGTPAQFLAGSVMALESRLGPPPRQARVGNESIHPDAWIHPTATLQGAVLVGAGSRIERDCQIIGPSVIGEGCRIGAGATLRKCVVLPGAEVHDDCEFHSELIGEGGYVRGGGTKGF